MIAVFLRFVAFLRAINVGGRTVKMEQLRRIFESIGLANVETVIASGNVVFDCKGQECGKAIEKKLQAKLEKSLGYTVGTYVRSMEELMAAIATCKPFKKIPKTGTLFIAFASDPPSRAAQEKVAFFANQDRQILLSRPRDLLALPNEIQRLEIFRSVSRKDPWRAGHGSQF